MGFEKRHQRVIVCIALRISPILPCLFVYKKIRQRDRRRKPQAQHSYVIYVPAPEIPRPRPLTPPLGNEQGKGGEVGDPERSAILRRTRTGAQSAFFRKLPLEIREMIYAEVLASESALFPKRVGNRLCCDRFDYEHFKTIYKDRAPDEIERIFKQHLKRPKGTIMGLLTSCRRMYAESISIFYTQNVFRFRDPGALNFVPTWIIPNRLQSIRHVWIDISSACLVKHPCWDRACEVVGLMGGLQKFVVTFQPRVARTDMTEYLYPMVQMTVPMIIIFAGENVCFHGGRRGREWFESLPFHVIRTDPQGS